MCENTQRAERISALSPSTCCLHLEYCTALDSEMVAIFSPGTELKHIPVAKWLIRQSASGDEREEERIWERWRGWRAVYTAMSAPRRISELSSTKSNWGQPEHKAQCSVKTESIWQTRRLWLYLWGVTATVVLIYRLDRMSWYIHSQQEAHQHNR